MTTTTTTTTGVDRFLGHGSWATIEAAEDVGRRVLLPYLHKNYVTGEKGIGRLQ